MNFLKLFIEAFIPISSIILAVTGIIQLRSGDVTTGVVCIFLAIATFVFSMRRLEKNTVEQEKRVSLKPASVPSVSWVIVVGLVVISVIYVADNVKSAVTDRIAVIAWVLAMLLGLFLTWWQTLGLFLTNKANLLKEKIRTNRKEIAILFLILFIAFLLRTVSLTSHPYPWSGDEASIGMEARRIIHGEITNYFDTGWSSQSNWSFFPTAVSEIVFGQNILAVRLTSVLAGILAVLFTYLTARVLFNPTIGLIAAAFLATLPYHVHFSRIGVHNIVDSLMSSLLFWLIAKGLKEDDPRFYYTAGVVGGLSVYTYAGTRLVLILSAITFLFVILRQRGYLAVHWRHLTAFASGVILSMAPQAAYFARHPDIFFGRLGQEGILFNGWLARRALETGQGQWDILLDQFKSTILVFVASP
ncbi:MAG TPA: glycosyltransferase family 39 protein, partial [Anaerolineales bacterium]|nr:glycosyltransferase family 39 protein [Anaerolineales bacterium]